MRSARGTSKPTWRRAASAAGLAVLLASCSAPPAPALPAEPPPPAAPTVSPALSINQLMVSWVDNASHVLWDVEKKGFAPKDEADWVEVEDHATQLVAAGTLIQLGGTGSLDAAWVKKEGWKTNAELLQQAGRAALAAAKNRNLPALVEANGTLVSSCEGCHKEFKPDAPTEGVAHQSPHSESHKSN